MLIAKPQASARKPPLALLFSRYKTHCEQPNSMRCLTAGQLPMQTATRVAEHPWLPLDRRASCPSRRCWLFTQECCWLPSSQWKPTSGHISIRPSLHHSSQKSTQEPHIASYPLKTSPWPAWILHVTIQRRHNSQFPFS